MDSNLARLPGPALRRDGASDILTAAVERLSTADSLERVTEVVTEAARALLAADGATFVLREDDQCFYADEDAISPLWKGSRFPMSACISGWTMLHAEVVSIGDIYVDDRIPHDAYRPTFVKSLTMAPVRSEDPIAALGAYWATEHVPDAEEVRLLQVLANSAAVALENLELRSAVRRRADERDDLAARADELESAIHTIAHDLRSPLGAILGYAELLEDALEARDPGPGPAPDRAVEFARTIGDSGKRMAEQIDRMLSLYRVTHRPLEPAPLDLTDMSLAIARTLGDTERGRDLDFTIEDGLVVEADPVLTHLLLENLLGNAVKYTAREKVARIALSSVHIDTVGTPDDLATFVLRDNGAGFPADQADRLFRPMTRLHRDDEFPGTGLGLASVARIVERHGGQVRAEGTLDEGASFYFTLPRGSAAS